jgi:hypothetical protein
MALVMKPVRFNNSTYLRVPKDAEELIETMTPRICTVQFQIDEKGCSLVYSFARPVPDLIEEPIPKTPPWLMERELVA